MNTLYGLARWLPWTRTELDSLTLAEVRYLQRLINQEAEDIRRGSNG